MGAPSHGAQPWQIPILFGIVASQPDNAALLRKTCVKRRTSQPPKIRQQPRRQTDARRVCHLGAYARAASGDRLRIISRRPHAACLGHLVCGGVGIAAFVIAAFVIAGPLAYHWAMGLAAPAVAVAVLLNWRPGCYHPPAAATAATPFLTAATMPVYAAAVVLGGALLFVAASALGRFNSRLRPRVGTQVDCF